MLDSNYRNTSCGFGEDLVAYLYDEIGAKEKSTFETHLDGCQSCVEELASFGMVRSSISEWQKNDFAGLSLPNVEIPFDENISTKTVVSSETEKTWLGKIQQIFSLTPTWANATAGFAVLAICAVFAFLAFNYTGSNEMAGENKENKSEDTPKIEKNVIQPKKEDVAENSDKNEKGSEEIIEVDNPNPVITKEIPVKKAPIKRNQLKKERVVAKNNKKQPQKTNKQEIKKPNDETMANQNKKQTPSNFDERKLPTLSPLTDEEDDDDSVRLTDLFDEIGKD